MLPTRSRLMSPLCILREWRLRNSLSHKKFEIRYPNMQSGAAYAHGHWMCPCGVKNGWYRSGGQHRLGYLTCKKCKPPMNAYCKYETTQRPLPNEPGFFIAIIWDIKYLNVCAACGLSWSEMGQEHDHGIGEDVKQQSGEYAYVGPHLDFPGTKCVCGVPRTRENTFKVKWLVGAWPEKNIVINIRDQEKKAYETVRVRVKKGKSGLDEVVCTANVPPAAWRRKFDKNQLDFWCCPA